MSIFRLIHKGNTYTISLGVSTSSSVAQMLSRLSPSELQEYHQLEARLQANFLRGRDAVKNAFRKITTPISSQQISVKKGAFNQPLLHHPPLGNRYHVSISHCQEVALALIFPEETPCGIDLEQAKPFNAELIRPELTQKELELALQLSLPLFISYTRFWTIKEALSKAIKTGLSIPLHFYELHSIRQKGPFFQAHFTYFDQYQAISFELEKMICSIVFPKDAVVSGFMNTEIGEEALT